MRPFVLLLSVFIAGIAFGQDPTVPSKALLQRLKSDPSRIVKQESTVISVFKLKAVVLVDDDHGTAIVEVDGRRYVLTLDRKAIVPDSELATSGKRFVGLQIGGIAYRLEDFSARTIVLSDGIRKIFVQ